jgi:hypothetical protein
MYLSDERNIRIELDQATGELMGIDYPIKSTHEPAEPGPLLTEPVRAALMLALQRIIRKEATR